MGLYDIVKVAPERLPVNTTVRKKIEKESVEWQTKDLDYCLSIIEITDSGRLTETIHDETIDLNYHGIFEFHSNIGKTWFSFLVKFTDGNLAGIVRIKERIKYEWPPFPLNNYFKNENSYSK
jgi:hypothetical protein